MSVVRAMQTELTNLLLSKLEDAEEVLLSKNDVSIAVTTDSLRDAATVPMLSTRNLTALLTEKLSKKAVLMTKDSLDP